MEKQKGYRLFRFIRNAVEFFYPKIELCGLENLPEEPSVLVGNHAQMNGPIIGELHLSRPRRVWCAVQMMERECVAAYAFEDFWSFKPKRVQWFYRILSHIIVPVSVAVFNNASTIPVYRDSRILTTFRRSIAALQSGEDIVIFPEHNEKHNSIVYDFQEHFIDLARMYYRKTHQALAFVPMYVAPKLKKVVYGKPTLFDPDAPIDEERERIRQYLMDSISALAYALPEHTVIPYRNIKKRDYPKNVLSEVIEK